MEQEKRLKEVARKRELAKTKLLPLLREAVPTIGEAKNFLQITSSAIRASANKEADKMMNDLKVGQLDIGLNPKDPGYKKFKAILDMFAHESVNSTLMLTEGMYQAIDALMIKEQNARKTSDINPESL